MLLGSLKASDDPRALLVALIAIAADPRFCNVNLPQLSDIPKEFELIIKRLKSLPQFTIFGRLPADKRADLIKSTSFFLTHSCQGGARYNIPSHYNDFMHNHSVIASLVAF